MKGFIKVWYPAFVFLAIVIAVVAIVVWQAGACRDEGGTLIGGLSPTSYCVGEERATK